VDFWLISQRIWHSFPKALTEQAMIVKILIFLGLVWAGYRIYTAFNNHRDSSTSRQALEKDMVSCDKCGVYLPKSDAIIADNRYFCSKKHVIRTP
jgi:hypothetical protein